MLFEKPDIDNPKPLHLQVADIIELKIKNKEISVGQKLPPQDNLRRTFSVSINTMGEAISRLVNEGYLVSKPSYGTFVASANPRKGVDLQRKNGICLVVCPPLEESGAPKKYNSEIQTNAILKGIEEKTREKGTFLTYSTLDGNELYLGGMEKHIAGLIVMGVITPEMFRIIRRSGISFVLIGDIYQKTRTEKDVDVVCTNDFENAYIATKYLIGLGHRRIAYGCNHMTYPWEKEALEGYRHAHSEAGIACDPALVIESKTSELIGGYQSIKEFLDKSIEFTALVDTSSLLGAGKINAFKEKGLRIPEDISIVGFMDGVLDPQLKNSFDITEIFCDKAEMGKAAAERLFEKLADPSSQARRVYVPCKLNIRDSARKIDSTGNN